MPALTDMPLLPCCSTLTTHRRYTKRALLVGVYSATELYMVNDCSPGRLIKAFWHS